MPGLVSFAVGFCAQRALRGRTIAGQNVLFEPGAPISTKEPIVTIHTAQGSAEMNGRNSFEAAGEIILRIELFLPCGITIDASDRNWALDTSSSLALPFALFWRQCEASLYAEQNKWADLFRSFVLDQSVMRSGADMIQLDTGMRIAARIVDTKLTCLASPRIGTAPVDKWAEFISAMRSDSDEISSIADLIEMMIQGGSELLDWQTDFSLLGLSQSLGRPLGLAPAGDITVTGYEPVVEAPADPTRTL